MKKGIIKFVGYVEIECEDQDDFSERLKVFCDDNDIQFEDHHILKTDYECEHCLEFREKFTKFEDSRGNDQECCDVCFQNWAEEDDDIESEDR